MTLRQLYYRLVSTAVIPNSQAAYKRLGGVMTRLREVHVIPRTWLVDHVRQRLKPSSWSGLADFGDTVREAYRKDFWASMDDHVEVFVEKDAMAGSIQPVTDRYDVALNVCRGYASVSFAGEIADLWERIEKPIFAYYIGDYDPSGYDLERDLKDKLVRYGEVEFTWTRLAVLHSDFGELDLHALPVKRSDTRSRAFIETHGTSCAEADAIPPAVVRSRVEDAILNHVDAEKWGRLQQVEEVERQSMAEFVDNWDGAIEL